jgi:hypothetical protein
MDEDPKLKVRTVRVEEVVEREVELLTDGSVVIQPVEGGVFEEGSWGVVADGFEVGGHGLSGPVGGGLVVDGVGLEEPYVVGADAEKEAVSIFETDGVLPAGWVLPLNCMRFWLS